VVVCRRCGTLNEPGQQLCSKPTCRGFLRSNQLARRYPISAVSTSSRDTVAKIVANRRKLTGHEQITISLIEKVDTCVELSYAEVRRATKAADRAAAIDRTLRAVSELNRLMQRVNATDPAPTLQDVMSALNPQDESECDPEDQPRPNH